MATLVYTGGLSKVIAPWHPRPEVKRGVPVEVSDEDAEVLTKEPGSAWVYVEPIPAPFTPEPFTPAAPVAVPEEG